jgi:hypothetical protein
MAQCPTLATGNVLFQSGENFPQRKHHFKLTLIISHLPKPNPKFSDFEFAACYIFTVTAGTFPSEIGWNIEGVGEIEGMVSTEGGAPTTVQICLNAQPSPNPTSTPVPTTSVAPSMAPNKVTNGEHLQSALELTLDPVVEVAADICLTATVTITGAMGFVTIMSYGGHSITPCDMEGQCHVKFSGNEDDSNSNNWAFGLYYYQGLDNWSGLPYYKKGAEHMFVVYAVNPVWCVSGILDHDEGNEGTCAWKASVDTGHSPKEALMWKETDPDASTGFTDRPDVSAECEGIAPTIRLLDLRGANVRLEGLMLAYGGGIGGMVDGEDIMDLGYRFQYTGGCVRSIDSMLSIVSSHFRSCSTVQVQEIMSFPYPRLSAQGKASRSLSSF